MLSFGVFTKLFSPLILFVPKALLWLDFKKSKKFKKFKKLAYRLRNFGCLNSKGFNNFHSDIQYQIFFDRMGWSQLIPIKGLQKGAHNEEIESLVTRHRFRAKVYCSVEEDRFLLSMQLMMKSFLIQQPLWAFWEWCLCIWINPSYKMASLLATDNNGDLRLFFPEKSLWQVRNLDQHCHSAKATWDVINLNIKKIKEAVSFGPLSWWGRSL